MDKEIEDIAVLAEEKKVQMIESNFKLRAAYSKRMLDKVDMFEDKIYDSSYMVWVPIIQKYMRPHI